MTFTAYVLDDGEGPVEVEILVNASPVKTCPNLSSGDTCVYTGGPYTAYEGTTVSYLANATDSGDLWEIRGGSKAASMCCGGSHNHTRQWS